MADQPKPEETVRFEITVPVSIAARLDCAAGVTRKNRGRIVAEVLDKALPPIPAEYAALAS